MECLPVGVELTKTPRRHPHAETYLKLEREKKCLKLIWNLAEQRQEILHTSTKPMKNEHEEHEKFINNFPLWYMKKDNENFLRN